MCSDRFTKESYSKASEVFLGCIFASRNLTTSSSSSSASRLTEVSTLVGIRIFVCTVTGG